MPVQKQTQRKHLQCVVCGQGFMSTFDEKLGVYPVYHSKSKTEFLSCESQFFEMLLKLYKCLHSSETSKQMNELMNDADWGIILLKREFLMWCLTCGYLTLDNLKRIIVPPAIDDFTKDLLSTHKLNDPNYIPQAMDYLKSAFHHLKDELHPTNVNEFDNLNPQKELAPEAHKSVRMHTVDLIGISQRNS